MSSPVVKQEDVGDAMSRARGSTDSLPSITDAFLRVFADYYRDCCLTFGRHALEVVASQLAISRETAWFWRESARRRGFLK